MAGKILSPSKDLGFNRPFLNIGRPDHGTEDSTWDELYGNMRGQSFEVTISGTHSSFTDYPAIAGILNLMEPVQKSLQKLLGAEEWASFNGIIKGFIIAFESLIVRY